MKWLKKLREIADGWKNVAFEDPEVEKLAMTRASICASCPLNNNSTCDSHKSELVGGIEVFGCGCPLIAKTRSPKSKCPLGKW